MADPIFGTQGPDNIVGTAGNDWIQSLAGDDIIEGGPGRDALWSSLGDDIMYGGGTVPGSDGPTGNDTYHITSLGDVIVEFAGEGDADRIHSYITYDMSAAAEVENMRLVGYALGLDAYGNDLDNTIEGNRAFNMLFGGNGDDSFIVYDTVDYVDGEADSNTVMVNFNADLSATANWVNIQNITLTGQANLKATGDANANTLTGNEGKSQLIGGLGDDTYVLGTNAGIKIVELSGGGTDEVRVEASFDLKKLKYVENLRLEDGGAFTAKGNDLDNLIVGNASSNTIDGGKGADQMSGGTGGSNVFIVDNVGDTVSTVITGVNLVKTSVSFDLSVSGVLVDNMILTHKNAVVGIGNAEDNTIIGSTAANTLDGGAGNDTLDGGKGNDTLIGGLGDDTYILDSDLDVATEGGTPGGTDIIMSNVKTKKTVVMDAEIENLTIIGRNSSNAIGNALDNTIVGNTGSNIISGMDGDDTITGTGGKNTLAGGAGNDVITGGSKDDIINGDADDDTISGGAGKDTITGGDGADTLTGGAGDDFVSGGAGDDLYIVGDDGDTLTELPGGGLDTVESSVDFTLGANFENLTLVGGAVIGGGNDLDNTITGSGASNTLSGGLGADTIDGQGGHDTINGGAGDDTMAGGVGDDVFIVDSANDIVTELVAAGTDTIMSSVTYDMSVSATGEVEILQLTGFAAIDGTGNAFDNTLIGNAAANVLAGGDGNDFYVVDLTDTVIENAGEGALDTIMSAFTYVLAPSSATYEVEGLTLTGFANINGTGNDLDNRLQGNAAINTLAGGTGNDTYVITSLADTQFDVIIENAGEGTADTIESAITYVLAPVTATLEIENLTLTGMADIHGIGNDIVNTITGNDGNNTLDGALAADTMIGGLGDDTYVVEDAGDVVTEDPGSGIDTILSSIDFDLSTDGANVENLTLTGTALVGTGNVLGNILTGNNSDNTLSGGGGIDTLIGGAGADTLIGGTGADLYVVDNPLDVVVEAIAEGLDTIQSSVSFDMGTQAAGEVENLILTGGLLNINGAGNGTDNFIMGNDGANIIDGADGDDTLEGGLGDDTLMGGMGNDTMDGGLGLDTLMGGVGDDVYIIDSTGKTVIENPGEGTVDEVQISIASYTLLDDFENLTLTGSLAINGTGNAADNIITGNAAANTLDGLVGADTMIGGGGNDVYMVDNAADVVDETAGNGVDTIYSSVTFDMSTQTIGAVENIVLLGAANIDATGNAFNNTIVGNSGINVLAGGAGDDTYFVTAGDSVIEAGGEGTLDTIISSISWIIAAGQEVEQLILTEAGGAINATGNDLGNTLVGNSSQNTFLGGLGDDTYDIGKSATLDVILADPGGIDTVMVGATYSIAGRADLDNITLVGTSKNNFNATGNAGTNILKGTEGKNILDGGAGADTMLGGMGDDTYIVDDALDVIDEMDPDLPGGGKDTINATVSYNMAVQTFGAIENLNLIGPNAFNGTGNDANNIIKGNALNNVLDGFIGADTMDGGLGNDTYYVDNTGDVIKDTGGIDTVISSLPFFTLQTGLENLECSNLAGDINITGNSAANTLIGNNGNNIIDGGKGADYMAGGAGDDIIFVDNVNDIVVELAGEGTMDVVKTKVNFTLADDQYVEVVEHIGTTGNLTGNMHDNTLIGNKGTNTLFGGDGNDTLIGGGGKDIYYGGFGDDTFVVDYFGNGVDVIKDFGLGGIDSILYGVDIDPLFQVLEDFVEYKHVGADTHVYLDFDSYLYSDYGPKLVAIVEDFLL